jgi:hypothetical protein
MGGGLMARARLCPEFPPRSAALRSTLAEAADHPADYR